VRESCVRALDAAGARTEVHWGRGGAEITDEEIARLTGWLNQARGAMADIASLPISREEEAGKGRYVIAAPGGVFAEMSYSRVNDGLIIIDHTDRGAFVVPGSPLGTAPDGFKAGSVAGGGEVYHARGFNFADFGGSGTAETDRNYHVFDLAEVSISQPIRSATLRIWADVGAYDSTAAFEVLGFFDVSTPAATLDAPTSTNGGAGVYDDLGTGLSYGSGNVTDVEQRYIEFALNQAAIDDIAAAVGVGAWSIGGALLSIDGTNNGFSERIFKNDSGTPSEPPAQLVLIPVPEPVSALLAGSGSVLLLPGRRRCGSAKTSCAP